MILGWESQCPLLLYHTTKAGLSHPSFLKQEEKKSTALLFEEFSDQHYIFPAVEQSTGLSDTLAVKAGSSQMHSKGTHSAYCAYLSSLKSFRKISSAFCRNCCIVLPFFICRSRYTSS